MIKTYICSLILWCCAASLKGQNAGQLPRSTPETEGVSSTAIISFLDAFEKSGNEPHSIMLLRHGKVIAEGWWKPYGPWQLHNMYSVSKSFTATAVGFAEADGLLGLDDKVISYFPSDLPDTLSDNLKALRIRDLLTMSVGMDSQPAVDDNKSDSWVKIFLAHPVIYKPGSRFLYNPMATYMLSAIVQQVTGVTTYEYLRKKLFPFLNIADVDWTTSPQKITSGGWGLRLRTEDMARFGQFYLQKGCWENRQLLPAAWMQQATSVQIIQHPDLQPASRDSSDWEQGYGYQFWKGLHNSYRADGAWGQFILIMPDQDAVLVITEEASDPQHTLNLVWKYLLPGMKMQKLSENHYAGKRLKRRLASLTLPLPEQPLFSQKAAVIRHAYSIQDNDIKISNIAVNVDRKGHCLLSVRKDGIDFDFRFAAGSWLCGVTKVRGIGHPAWFYTKLKEAPASNIAGTYYWEDERTLKLVLQYTQSLFNEFINKETITLHFKGKNVIMELDDNRGWKVKCTGSNINMAR